MPTSKTKQPALQLTISLSEVEALRNRVAQLEQENAGLKVEREALGKQVRDLTDPAKNADAAAYKASRRR